MLSLLFFPFFPKEDDALCRKLCQGKRERVIRKLSAKDLMGLMARSIGVLGMRYHALVFAQNAGVSFLAIGKDEKLKSFCDEHQSSCFE